MTEKQYKEYLQKKGLSNNSVESYLLTIRQFFKKYKELNKQNLSLFKAYLIEHYKPQSVNLKIIAINNYLKAMGDNELRLKTMKFQQKTYVDNVISDADYRYFKTKLKKDKRLTWYFVVWFLATTGARVSELVQIKVENVILGYVDIYGKGGKMRRLYIPKVLKKETLNWLQGENISSGYLFKNRLGERLTTRGIAHQLKIFAREYGINENVVYPHSFRHRFAKNFLEKYNDIALLADLMGHESIETTRIYLRKSSTEQHEIIDKVVNW